MGEQQQTYQTRGGAAPPDQDGQAQERPSRKVIPLKGAMIGVANDISEVLYRAKMSGNHRALIELIRRDSQGNAGYQRDAGLDEPGLSCAFDLANWAYRLGWDKSYTRRVRDRLIADKVVWFIPDTQAPGLGRIGINLTFPEWLPLDHGYVKALHSRPGAGRPHKQHTEQQTGVDSGITEADERGQWELPEADERGQWDIETTSVHGHLDLEKNIPLSTLDSYEVATAAARSDALRKEREEDTEESRIDANASMANGASAPLPTPPAHHASQTLQATTAATAAKRPRKLTDGQLAAHREEAAYIGSVLTLYRAELHVVKLPVEKQQREGARWFYTAGPDGGQVAPEDVLLWYRLTKAQHWWQGKFLSLVSLQKPYTEHAGNLSAYRETVAQEAHEQREREAKRYAKPTTRRPTSSNVRPTTTTAAANATTGSAPRLSLSERSALAIAQRVRDMEAAQQAAAAATTATSSSNVPARPDSP